MRKPYFMWNEETGSAICIITDKNEKRFIGEAFCHPEDKDFISEKVGCEIAERRAEINYLKHIRDNVLTPEIKALKHFHSVISQSKQYKEKNYENRMLQRQIENKELELEAIRNMIEAGQVGLNAYLKNKEQFRKSLRRLRKDKTE